MKRSGPAAPAPDDAAQGKERNRRALLSTSSALAGRGLGMVLSFVSVPLTVGYLDAERYGLWVTISSTLAWLGLADLGLSNGLSNAVTAARARGEREVARRVVSTAAFMLGGIALAMLLVFAAASPFVPWGRVFAVSSRVDPRELDLTVALCVAIFALSFPLGIVDRVLGACQEAYLANYLATGSSVLATAALIVAVRRGGGLPTLVVALSVVPLVARAGSTVWVFGRLHPELRPSIRECRKDVARTLLATGVPFLVVQLAALGNWQNDNIIIDQLYGPAAVGPYSVAFKLAVTYVGVVNMYLSPLWPAYADAAAREDYAWIGSTLRRTRRLTLAATVVAAVGMLAVGPWVIEAWIRKPSMVPSRGLLLPIAVYMVVVVFCQVHAVALNGFGRLRGQMIYGIVSAVVNVGLSIVLGLAVGVTGVCWATCIAAVGPGVLVAMELSRELRTREAAAREKQGTDGDVATA